MDETLALLLSGLPINIDWSPEFEDGNIDPIQSNKIVKIVSEISKLLSD
jgi:hypothetical protein